MLALFRGAQRQRLDRPVLGVVGLALMPAPQRRALAQSQKAADATAGRYVGTQGRMHFSEFPQVASSLGNPLACRLHDDLR